MRDVFPRPAVTPYVLSVALLALLSGCGMMRPTPAPISEATIIENEPAPASETEAATPPVAASESDEGEARPTAKKPRPAPVRRPTPLPPPPAPKPPPPAPAPAPLIATRTIARAQVRTLLDSEVQKADGKVIGRAVDLVVGPGGKPVEMVINLQGFMGIGDRKAAFPWSAVHVSTKPNTPAVTLQLGPGQQSLPDRPKAGSGGPQPGGAEATPTRLPVIDSNVERSNGARVGRVIDVLLDGEADPQAVVLDVSGALEKRRTIAADWSALRFVTRENALTALLDLSDAQIDAAPTYVADQPVRAVSPLAPKEAASPPVAASPGSAGSAASPARGVNK